MADIAAEAGIAPPTLIQRFGSKRGLLLDFAAQAKEGVRRAFAEARASSESPLATLVAALIRLTGPIRTRRALANHLAFLQLDLNDPEFHRHARTHAQALREQIGVMLGEAMDRGELKPIYNVDRLARAVQSMFNGALLRWAVDGEGTVDDVVRESIETLLLRVSAEVDS